MRPLEISMKKYFLITKNETQRMVTYRANISAFSLGHIFEVMAQVVVWTAIFAKTEIVNGYSYNQMMTYVVVGWFILFATSNYGFEDKVAKDISQGMLSNFLVKPFSYLKYMVSLSIGRISFALVVVVGIEVLLFWYFKSNLILLTDWRSILLILALIIEGFIVRLFFAISIGLTAFWFTDINGFNFSFNIMSKFLAGAFFPLALLPAVFVKISMWFPFAYTFFIPIQLYLGKISLLGGIKAVVIQAIWLLILYAIIKIIWHRGLHQYESAGI